MAIETMPVPTAPVVRPSTQFTPLDDLSNPFILDPKTQTYSHQYASIYYLRLDKLKETLLEASHAKWAKAAGNPKHVKRVLDIKKGKLSYVVGTVYLDMPLKPSILEDIVKDDWTAAPPPREKYYGSDDAIMLEDESGRVKLVGSAISKAQLVTGIIIGALGMETAAGDFEVADYCLPGMPPQSLLGTAGDKMEVDGDASSGGEWVALVSGLEIGLPGSSTASNDSLDTSIQLLTEYLLGEAGGEEDQKQSSSISRLIIAGNSVVPVILDEDDDATKSKRFNASKTKYDPTPLYNLTSLLTEISRALPTHILPGSTDPTGTSIPQQPLPRPMFGKELAGKTKQAFVCETNPTWIGVGDCELLVGSGQTIDDLFKYIEGVDRMDMAKNTLRWRHIAPTAPDTLWCYPFKDYDPFILPRCPHIYVIGNQPQFATEILEGAHGQRTRIILLPKFSQSGCLTLVNTRSLEVKTVSFKVA